MTFNEFKQQLPPAIADAIAAEASKSLGDSYSEREFRAKFCLIAIACHIENLSIELWWHGNVLYGLYKS